MNTSALPNYEVPELLVYGSFRELTQLDWAMGIYPAPKVKKPKKKKKDKKPKFGGCQVSGFGSSSCASSSS
jgi:hypothetical protein